MKIEFRSRLTDSNGVELMAIGPELTMLAEFDVDDIERFATQLFEQCAVARAHKTLPSAYRTAPPPLRLIKNGGDTDQQDG